MKHIVTCGLMGLAFAVAGCGGPSAYERVFAGQQQHANVHTCPANVENCWTAVNRSVLALQFAVDRQDKANGTLDASRFFNEGRRTTTIRLNASLQPAGTDATTVYANAVQTRQRMFTRSHRRFFLWIIPLPGGGGVEATAVTEGVQTVTDPKFYRRLFDAMDRELTAVKGGRT